MRTTPPATSRSASELTDSSASLQPSVSRYSLIQRCRSLYHGLWFRLSERIWRSRRPYHETPIGFFSGLAPWQITRIDELRARYDVRFESQYGHHTALANYAYLDLLNQAWTAANRSVPTGGLVTDVGCANFWYARTLHRFFRPAKLTGVDVEGFRLYPTGYSRYDAAAGYITPLSHTSFVIADYCEVEERVDVITAWFPFVTPSPVLAWRLPLTVFSPARLCARIARNLSPEGTFFMANQESAEAQSRRATVAGRDFVHRANGFIRGHYVRGPILRSPPGGLRRPCLSPLPSSALPVPCG